MGILTEADRPMDEDVRKSLDTFGGSSKKVTGPVIPKPKILFDDKGGMRWTLDPAEMPKEEKSTFEPEPLEVKRYKDKTLTEKDRTRLVSKLGERPELANRMPANVLLQLSAAPIKAEGVGGGGEEKPKVRELSGRPG